MALAEWLPSFDKETLTLKILLAQLKNRTGLDFTFFGLNIDISMG